MLAGKTVLCANLIRFLKQDQTTILYYFCNNYRSSETNSAVAVFSAYCCQLIQTHEPLCSYIYDEYICKGLSPSSSILSQALHTMLSSVENVRIIIDGVDEWDHGTVKRLLTDLMRLTTISSSLGAGPSHKLLISSRDELHINHVLLKKPFLSLSDEGIAISTAIRTYAHATISDIRDRLSDNVDASVVSALEDKLVEKSNGMLWSFIPLLNLNPHFGFGHGSQPPLLHPGRCYCWSDEKWLTVLSMG